MDIEKNFTYHEPTEEQAVRYANIRNTAKQLAIVIDACCPECCEKDIAMTKAEEAVMWANAAIARHYEKGE